MEIIGRLRKFIGIVVAVFVGLRCGFRTKPLVFVDIGGRGGLPRRWQILFKTGIIAPVFFEPDPVAAAEIVKRYQSTASGVVIEQAVWSKPGEATLHITAEPGCSSLLPPKPDVRTPEVIKSMLAVERLVGVRVEKAETALVDRNIVPDVVKIDIQGGELEALKGFGSLLDKVVCVELEVSLMSIYEGQPLFGEIFDFMTDKGFGLFDVQVFGVAGPRNAIQSNAFFCRREMTGPRQKAIEYIFRCTNDFILRP